MNDNSRRFTTNYFRFRLVKTVFGNTTDTIYKNLLDRQELNMDAHFQKEEEDGFAYSTPS